MERECVGTALPGLSCSQKRPYLRSTSQEDLEISEVNVKLFVSSCGGSDHLRRAVLDHRWPTS